MIGSVSRDHYLLLLFINSYYPSISTRASSCLLKFYVYSPFNSGLTGFVLPILSSLFHI